MSTPSYLLSTSKGFFFRMRVPKDLQPVLKKRELKKAIRTTDSTLASRKAIIYAAQAFELFDSLLETSMNPLFHKMIIEQPDGTKLHLKDKNVAAELKLLIESGVVKLGRDIPAPLAPAVPVVSPQGLMLSEAIDAYFREKHESSKKYNEFKEKEARAPLKLLVEFLGDVQIDSITREKAKEFRVKLQLLPRNRRTAARQGLTFMQLIDLGEKDVISTETVNQRLTAISSLFKWLVDEDKLAKNPFHGLGVEDDTSDSAIRKRNSFSPEDVTNIFKLPIWTGKKFSQTWEFWLPLLLLHTGARVGELCQLERKDVLRIGSVWCISINDIPTKDEPEDVWGFARKRVKTSSSTRMIPIHSRLIDLGFLRFVETIPSGRLFPTINPVSGKLSHYPCKRFNEVHLERAGVKVPFKKTFYSFRHTVMNELKKQRVNVEERGQLAGHTPETVTERYGDEFEVLEMQKLVEKLDFSSAIVNILPW